MRKDVRIWLSHNDSVIVVYAILVVSVILVSFMNPLFMTSRNVGNLLEQSTSLGLAAIGQSLVILTGGIDLSVGSTIGLTVAVLTTVMDNSSTSILSTILLVIVIGALIGTINGIGIIKLKIPPFVMTLGMMSIVMGVALKILPVPGGDIPTQFSDTITLRILNVPISTIFFIIILAVFIFILKNTRLGRNIYAIGGNQQTSQLSGIKVDRMKMFVYIMSGIFSALAGIYIAARMGTGDASVGTYLTLDSVTVAVLGGLNLLGGRGNLIGIIASLFVLSILSNILNLIGVMSFYQYVLKGAILIIVVLLYAIRKKK